MKWTFCVPPFAFANLVYLVTEGLKQEELQIHSVVLTSPSCMGRFFALS